MSEQPHPKRAMSIVARYKKAIGDAEYGKFMKVYYDEGADCVYVMIYNISGNDDEYVGGEYLIKLTFPPGYPYKPMDFVFLTPNGVFGGDQTPCINIGKYHSDDQRGVLGIAEFARELVNGMICYKDLGSGINIQKTSVEKKKELARESREYNRKNHPEIVRWVNDNFSMYSAKWKSKVE